MTDRVNGGIERRAVLGPQPDQPTPVKPPLEHFAVDGIGSFEDHARPRLQFLPGVHQRLPHVNRVGVGAGAESQRGQEADSRCGSQVPAG